MTARLPNPGSDEGTWGNVLNEFLEQSHNIDGSLKLAAVAAAGGMTTISDGSVTTAKLDTTLQSAINKANGSVQDSTVTTKGDMLVASAASTLNRLPSGGANTYLKSDGSGNLSWAAVAGGSSANADAILTVAASDTQSALKSNADYSCDGTADDVEIQLAIDAAMVNASGAVK